VRKTKPFTLYLLSYIHHFPYPIRITLVVLIIFLYYVYKFWLCMNTSGINYIIVKSVWNWPLRKEVVFAKVWLGSRELRHVLAAFLMSLRRLWKRHQNTFAHFRWLVDNFLCAVFKQTSWRAELPGVACVTALPANWSWVHRLDLPARWLRAEFC
jgi:hypothetical protein